MSQSNLTNYFSKAKIAGRPALRKAAAWLSIPILTALPATAQAERIDCGKAASQVEKLVCGDNKLLKLDESLNTALTTALERGDIKNKIMESQKQWLKYERDICESPECLKEAYETRISELHFTKSYGIIFGRGPAPKPLPGRIPSIASEPHAAERAAGASQTPSAFLNRRPLELAGRVSIVAGARDRVGAEDGIGRQARFSNPFGITTDGRNLYVSETSNHTIRKIEIATGRVTTLSGWAGERGYADGAGRAARFNYPYGLATDGVNLYVADSQNYVIRRIEIATGSVTTLAGTPGVSGYADGSGMTAKFSFPWGIVLLGGNLYVTENHNHTVRKIAIATGEVSTLAGRPKKNYEFTDGIGPAARFNFPTGIATDGTDLFVADSMNQTIRRVVIATGAVTTLAGPDNDVCAREGHKGRCPSGTNDGVGAEARFANPFGMTSDRTHLYVADGGALRRITIATGRVKTLSGVRNNRAVSDSLKVIPFGWQLLYFNLRKRLEGILISSRSIEGIMNITHDGKNIYVTNVIRHTILKIE